MVLPTPPSSGLELTTRTKPKCVEGGGESSLAKDPNALRAVDGRVDVDVAPAQFTVAVEVRLVPCHLYKASEYATAYQHKMWSLAARPRGHWLGAQSVHPNNGPWVAPSPPPHTLFL